MLKVDITLVMTISTVCSLLVSIIDVFAPATSLDFPFKFYHSIFKRLLLIPGTSKITFLLKALKTNLIHKLSFKQL